VARNITDSQGRRHGEDDSAFDNVRIDNLEQTVRELIVAVGELQHRLAAVDKGDLRWPGDTYQPPGVPPEIHRDE
jgi:hypothetical protein